MKIICFALSAIISLSLSCESIYAQGLARREEPILAGPAGPEAIWMQHKNETLELHRGWDASWGGYNTNAPVYFIKRFYSNGEVVAGAFDSLAGKPCGRIAMIDPYDSLSPRMFGSGINDGIVYAYAERGYSVGQQFAGGHFRSAGKQTVNNIARWDASTEVWRPLAGANALGTDSTVLALALIGESQDSLLVAGNFTHAGGIEANHIAIWNITESKWEPVIVNGVNGVNGGVACITVVENYNHAQLLLGGGFSRAGDIVANRIVEYLDGQWIACGQGILDSDGVVETIARDRYHYWSQNLYFVGGHFATVGGNQRSVDIAMLDADTLEWSAFENLDHATGTVYAIGSSVYSYFGGDFHTNSSNISDYFFSDDKTIQSDLGAFDGPVYSIDAMGAVFPEGYSEEVFIAGDFRVVSGRPADRIIHWENHYDVQSTRHLPSISVTPGNHGINVDLPGALPAKLEAVDLCGRGTTLWEGTLSTGLVTLPTRLDPGPYLIIVRTADGMATCKVLVE
jgi:hypothetical protein